MSDAADRALEQLAELWRRERETTRARFRAEREGVPLGERVARGLALMDLVVDELDAGPAGRTMLWLRTTRPEGLEPTRIGPGDPVRLWRWDPDGDEAVRATVAKRTAEQLGVVPDEDLPDELPEEGLRLDADAPQATFDRGARAIERFRDADEREATGRLREVLLGERAPSFGDEPALSGFDEGLNEPQRAAVARALAADDAALVHGPPGTGKTRTLVEVVRQAVAAGERVLATAASNAAVDNLAERLAAADVAVVRLGHPARVAEPVQARTLEALLEGADEWRLARRWIAEAHEQRRTLQARRERGRLGRRAHREGEREVRALLRDAGRQLDAARERVLDRCTVVCATAAGAEAGVLGDRRFDRVVVDEATQAPDPVALVALARGDRAVLAGDPCQLPPTVIDPDVAREGLASTLFERLAAREGDRALRMLVVQHRMNEPIMAFPSRSMYEGRLEAAPAVRAHRLEDLSGVEPDPLRPEPLVFVDTAGRGWTEEQRAENPSTRNPEQAERTVREVRRLLGRGVAARDLGVIAPYHGHVRLLRERLARERLSGLEIDTVDAFQGREKEAVVVDLVRANEEGRIGFLADTRRMNVALTRARRFLLVVGDSATLGGHAYYADFLEAVERGGAWVSAWADDAPPFEA